MKKEILTFLFSSFIVFLLQGQSDVHYIKLKRPAFPIDELEFRYLKVIDGRRDTTNLGYVNKILHKNPLRTQLKGGLESSIKNLLDDMLNQVITERPKFVFIFHEIQILESLTSSTQHGYCKVELEIARKTDGQLYSLGIFEAEANNRKIDVTWSHGKRIRRAIKKCLKTFNETDWENNQGELIDATAIPYTYDYKSIPPQGLYRSFGELAQKKALKGLEFDLEKVIASEKYDDQYFLILEKEELADQIRYISDGTHIYLYAGKLAQKSTFLKAVHQGRYWLFVTRYSIPEIGIVFGLFEEIASYKGRIVYFDTQTKKLRKLNDFKIIQLTKMDHPEIFEAYKKSKRKLKDRKEVIIKLNEKYLLAADTETE